VFHINDLPLAEYLQGLLNGRIQKPKDKGYVLWEIQDIAGLTKIAAFGVGAFRSPQNRGSTSTNKLVK
jgi:hypothetical protein